MSDFSFTNPNSNVYKIVSASIYALIAGISVFSGAIGGVFDLFQYSFQMFGNSSGDYFYALINLQGALAELLQPLGAIVLGVMVFVSQSRKLLLWVNLSWALFIMPVTWIITAFYVSSLNIGITLTPDLLFFQGLVDPILGYSLILLVAASSVLAFLARNSAVEISVASQVEGNAGTGMSQLPLITMICAFVFPIVGIITGHMALNQIRRGQIGLENKNLATIGLVLSYVFTVTSLIALIIVFSFFMMLANWQHY